MHRDDSDDDDSSDDGEIDDSRDGWEEEMGRALFPDHSYDHDSIEADDEDDESEHFTYEDATKELKDILQASDEGTRQAINVRSDDKEAKAAWWSERKKLDLRMKELLDNIEFCWLGAFKVRVDSLVPFHGI